MSDTPHIWIPRCKILEPKREILLPARCGGRFKLTAIRPDGRERPLTGWFSNLVLDQGLDMLGTIVFGENSFMEACRVGTGNTPPDASQQNLIAHVAGTTSVSGGSSGTLSEPPYYAWRIRTYRFPQGAAAGNLAEVGVGTSPNNGNNLFSRELIRDDNGNPTTVTVLEDEFLDVTYEHRLYPADLSDVEDSVEISSVEYTTVSRAARCGDTSIWSVPSSARFSLATAYSGSIGAVTGSPSGSAADGGMSSAAYTPGAFERDYTASWGLNAANYPGGITAMLMQFGNLSGNPVGFGASQMSFNPAIPKTASTVLSLTYRRSWGRKTL